MIESDLLPVFHVVGFTGHRQLKRGTGGVERAMREVLTSLRAESPTVEWLALSAAPTKRLEAGGRAVPRT